MAGVISLMTQFKEHTYVPKGLYDAMIATIKSMGNGDFVLTPVFDKLKAFPLADINEGDVVQEVGITLTDSDGVLMDWYTGELTATVATSGAGVASDPEGSAIATVSLVNGVGSIMLKYTGTWVNDETVTVTVGNTDKIMGVSLTKIEPVVLEVEAEAE